MISKSNQLLKCLFTIYLIIVSVSAAYSYAHSYNEVDPRYFRHGSQRNEIDGGTCAEFVRINRMDTCCTMRDDDCYMIHYDTRCYCDVFCNREVMNDHSDCCPDAVEVCVDNYVPTNVTQGSLFN